VLFGALGTCAWWTTESLVLSQSVSESRTVADMAENVGRWASQYGGVHVRTIGTEAKIPGSFLTRAVYAANGGDATVLAGSRAGQSETERDAMQRVEAYHWKNPALVQREMADVIAASGSKARYRLTARTVLNTNNAPNAFEIEAMDALQAGDEELPHLPRLGRQGAGVPAHQRTVQRRRRLRLRGGQAGRRDQRRAAAAEDLAGALGQPAGARLGRARRGAAGGAGAGVGAAAPRAAGLISRAAPARAPRRTSRRRRSRSAG
jgi:hypothetical protein